MKNCYTARFDLKSEDIHRLSACQPDPLLGLCKLNADEAVKHIHRAHEALFVPTQQTTALLESFLASARAHSKLWYCDQKVVGVHMMGNTRPEVAYLPMCLTGLAGVGKTTLFDALFRILQTQVLGDAGGAVNPFALQAAVRVKLRRHVSNTEFLKAFIDQIGPGRLKCPSPADELAHKLFVYAVCLAITDELQFLTGSAGASVRAAQILLLLSSLQVPQIFAANYSMCRRLMGRPQEERDRIFSRVFLLRPELPETEDWIKTVEGYVNLLPEEFAGLKVEDLASTMYPLTFGLKRQLAHLIELAYLAMRQDRSVRMTLAHIDKAYRSRSYSEARDDVHLLLQQSVTGSDIPMGLTCPFHEVEDKKAQKAVSAQQPAFAHVVAKAMVEGRDRQARAAPKSTPRPRASAAGSKEPIGNVVSMKESLEEKLEASMAVLRNGLKLT